MYNIYKNTLLIYPKTVLIIVLAAIALLSTYIPQVEIDASSETLLLKNDKDLAFTREVNKRYYNPDFLVITYSPNNHLLSKETLSTIKELTDKLTQIQEITTITSILNVPLLQSNNKSLKELLSDIPTLSTHIVDLDLVKQEFLTSPIYANNLVSKDFKTTALLVYLKEDAKYFELLNKRNTLLEKEHNQTLSPQEHQTLIEVKEAFKTHRDHARALNHQIITQIRTLLHPYEAKEKLFLGGVNMITDDMISFVQYDLRTYGLSVLALLVIIMWIVFRQWRFILLPVFILSLSVMATTGLLGIFHWEVTVISSNFISLQLIITMSLIIHLIVRYRELLQTKFDLPHKEIILEATHSMLKPSFFVIITTIAGFSSLVASNILPVINLGWMMSAGISISLILTFLVFPTTMILLGKKTPYTGFENHFTLTKKLGHLAVTKARWILATTIALIIFSLSGAAELIVENSFINYFKKSTEIYQGMETIDKQLGGTTPLDVIVTFEAEPKSTPALEVQEDDFFDDFETEFTQNENDEAYWFTALKMEKIEAIHDYLQSLPEVGKVQSFATTLKIGRIINGGEDLDNLELALLYKKLPNDFKAILLTPYLSLEHNQVRFNLRIIDSLPHLRRNELLRTIENDLHVKLSLPQNDVRLASMMVMYNNMLQSLFNSQIKTLGLVLIILMAMFYLLFRSFKIALIATITDVVAVGVVFGFMGWAGIPLDMMTITIAAISLGIAVDDAIHYLHRFKNEVQKDGNYEAALHRAHASIGYAMYYTTLAIMLGFSVLILSNFVPTIYFGLLTVLAMLMALLANLILLPRLLLWLKPF
jgi:predicted RND superfamily exporter protein